MKQILLLRHAKVDIANDTAMLSEQLEAWIKHYDTAPIHTHTLPHKDTLAHIRKAEFVLTSSLSRTIDTAGLLGLHIDESNGVFNEAKIPLIHIAWLKLKPKTWLGILRVLLIFGLGKKDTSLKASKKQAKEAADRLVALSKSHEHIVLIGHGGMNWLIRKALMREGWHLEANASHKNLGMTALTFKENVTH